MTTDYVSRGRGIGGIFDAVRSALPTGYRETLLYTIAFQSGFYVLGALWALLGIESFMAVTGPKTDVWLVKTVALLLLVIGSSLGLAAARRTFTPEILLLATGAAFSLLSIDLVYVIAGRISPVYLLDALAQIVILAALGRAWTAKPVSA